jgi:hypothetical protein
MTASQRIQREHETLIAAFVANRDSKGLAEFKAKLQQEPQYCAVETPPPQAEEAYFANCDACEETLNTRIPAAELELKSD